MRRLLANAALVAVLLAPAAWAQRHGGGGFSSRGGGGFRGPSMAGRSGFVFRGSNFGGFRSGAFRRPGFFPGRGYFPNRYFYNGYYRGNSWYPYVGVSFGYPYYYYSSYYPAYSYPVTYESDPAYTYAPPANYVDSNHQAQQDQIDRLQDEVDRLREERTSQPISRAYVPRPVRQPPVAAPPPAQPAQATVLVFKDKRRQEVTNYAVVGQTLWIFTEQRANRLPLADLDVNATTAANEARGIDFQLPVNP